MEEDAWWNLFRAYNDAIFPMQIITTIVAGVLTYVLFAKPSAKANYLMKAYLAFSFGWIGIVFYLMFGKELPGILFAPPLFIIVAILFGVDYSKRK